MFQPDSAADMTLAPAHSSHGYALVEQEVDEVDQPSRHRSMSSSSSSLVPQSFSPDPDTDPASHHSASSISQATLTVSLNVPNEHKVRSVLAVTLGAPLVIACMLLGLLLFGALLLQRYSGGEQAALFPFSRPTASPFTSAYYEDCVDSFRNREHPLNDGIALLIGILSQPDRQPWRNTFRDTQLRWLDRTPVNVTDYCRSNTEAAYILSRNQGQPLPTSFRPVLPSPHLASPASNSLFCSSPQCAGRADSDGECQYENQFRHYLDMSWQSVYDRVEAVFVIGEPQDVSLIPGILREQERHGDLWMIRMKENKDGGKVYVWTTEVVQQNDALLARWNDSSLSLPATTADYGWDYVMKMDDDSFLHLPNTARTFRAMRAKRLPEVYYGMNYRAPGDNPARYNASQYVWLMSGMAYTLSMDLLAPLAGPAGRDIVTNTSDPTPNQGLHIPVPNPLGAGNEDALFAVWMQERGHRLNRSIDWSWTGYGHLIHDEQEGWKLFHGLIHNWINAAPRYYMHPLSGHAAQNKFRHDTECIHWAKNFSWYQHIVDHFLCGLPRTFTQYELGNSTYRYPEWMGSYKFDDNGDPIPEKGWDNDWSQSYRQSVLGNDSVAFPI